MKKAIVLLTVFVFAGLVACGPSAKEKQAMEAKAYSDSVARADSINSLLQKASAAASDSMAHDSTSMASNPAHGMEGHKCGPECPAMKK